MSFRRSWNSSSPPCSRYKGLRRGLETDTLGLLTITMARYFKIATHDVAITEVPGYLCVRS